MADYSPTNPDAYATLMDQQANLRTQLASDSPPSSLYATAQQLLTGIDMTGAGVIPGDKVIISADTNGVSRNGTFVIDKLLSLTRGVLRTKDKIPASAVAAATITVKDAALAVTRIAATVVVLVTDAATDPDSLLIADVALRSRGVQGHDTAAATANNSPGGAAFTNVPGFTSWTITPSLKRNYTVEVNLSFFLHTTTGLVTFQLTVGGTPYSNAECALFVNQVDVHRRLVIVLDDIPFDPIATALSLQWKSSAGELHTDTNDFRRFRVIA